MTRTCEAYRGALLLSVVLVACGSSTSILEEGGGDSVRGQVADDDDRAAGATADRAAEVEFGPFDGDTCPVREVTMDIRPAPSTGPSLDYLALRGVEVAQPFTAVIGWDSVRSEFGSRCASATNREACEAAYAALEPEADITHDYFDRPALTYTAGDEVGRVETIDELVPLLGEIDTGDEAALVAYLAGYDVVCMRGGNVARRDDGAFVIWATDGGTCLGELKEYELVVGPDGTVAIAEEIVITFDDYCTI
ncbi:MAG: hypothetical protein AAGA56_23290 [Myxococcota bacterium]